MLGFEINTQCFGFNTGHLVFGIYTVILLSPPIHSLLILIIGEIAGFVQNGTEGDQIREQKSKQKQENKIELQKQ